MALKIVGEMWLENSVDCFTAQVEESLRRDPQFAEENEEPRESLPPEDSERISPILAKAMAHWKQNALNAAGDKANMIRPFLGEELVPYPGQEPLPFEPWSGKVENYSRRNLYYVLNAVTKRVVGTMGRKTNLSKLKPWITYLVAIETGEDE